MDRVPGEGLERDEMLEKQLWNLRIRQRRKILRHLYWDYGCHLLLEFLKTTNKRFKLFRLLD